MDFRIISNYTEIDTCTTLAEAKKRAVAESVAFDDIVVIESGAQNLYMARYGKLYRLTPTR